MSDSINIEQIAGVLDEEGKPDTSNDLVYRDEHGDPVQDNGSRMFEADSYERVIEGLKIMADAASHLMAREPENRDYWARLRRMLDSTRRAAIQVAQIEDPIRARPTADVRGEPMRWREAHDRFRDGAKQSAGGMRQLAACHRMDLVWSKMANDLEAIVAKHNAGRAKTQASAIARGLLWLPDGYR